MSSHRAAPCSVVELYGMIRLPVPGELPPEGASIDYTGTGLAGLGASVVYDQISGFGARIVRGDLQGEIGKLGRRARERHLGERNSGEMYSRLGFDAADDSACTHNPLGRLGRVAWESRAAYLHAE
jgi:hypothetical protein